METRRCSIIIEKQDKGECKKELSSLKKRIIIISVATLTVLFVFSIPALAAYRYSATHFRYIGDIFHERTIEFFGGEAGFQISGQGTVSGSQEVTTVRYDGSPARHVYDQTAANLSLNLYGTTDPQADDENKLRMLSGLTVDVGTKTDVFTGVEMDPGESGYIKQTVSTTNSIDGEYMRVNNNFGNTGGTTKRNMEVEGFISDTMRVDGYAEVWETTTVRDGNATSGWWSIP